MLVKGWAEEGLKVAKSGLWLPSFQCGYLAQYLSPSVVTRSPERFIAVETGGEILRGLVHSKLDVIH